MSSAFAVAALQSLAHLSLISKPVLVKTTSPSFILRIVRKTLASQSTANSTLALIELKGVVIPVQRPVVINSERWRHWDTTTIGTLNGGTLVYKPQSSTKTFFTAGIIPFLTSGNFDDYLQQVKTTDNCMLNEGKGVCCSEVEHFLGSDAREQWVKAERLLNFIRYLVLDLVQFDIVICEEPIYINSSYTTLEVTVSTKIHLFLRRLFKAGLRCQLKSNQARPTVILKVPT